MKVLLVHNRYRQRGGEDAVFETERELLRTRGVRVVEFLEHNDRVPDGNLIGAAATAVWAPAAYRALLALMNEEKPDVVHFHNTFLRVSPAAYYAARRAGVPVVQTLHNPRIFCPAANGFRRGRSCSDCLGRAFAWPGILHACYRDSRVATAAVAGMTATHRLLRTWRRMVHVYVALTEHGRRTFIRAGLPADRLVVKPNALEPDPGLGEHRGGYALYAGRLFEEKGIRTLLDAWQRVGRGRTLRIAGAGPLESLFERGLPGVEFLGPCAHERVVELMKDAAFLVLPVQGTEGFPMAVVEAFATGVPVLTTTVDPMDEIVREGVTGFLVPPRDVEALAAAARRAFDDPAALRRMGRQARREYEHRYSGDRAFRDLLAIYRTARRQAAGHGAA